MWKLEKRLKKRYRPKKKKSLKEMRTGPVKRKESSVKLTESEKKMFKEAFNTDKTRLEKRHAKYDKPANFLILVEDNVHQAGPCGAGTAGMTMVYGRGKLMDQFLGEGVKHDSAQFYIHKNTFDFQKNDVAKNVDTGDSEAVEVDATGDKDGASKSASLPTKYDLYLEASRKEREKATSSLDNSF